MPVTKDLLPTKAPCGLCAGESCNLLGGNDAVCAPGLTCTKITSNSIGKCQGSDTCKVPFACYTPGDLYKTGAPKLVGCP